jgi:hypothetical protein
MADASLGQNGPDGAGIRELFSPGQRMIQAGVLMHFLVFGIGLYFLPAIVAAVRHTHNAGAILFLNLFLGWTCVGWFIALVMAMASQPSCAYYYSHRGW